MTNSKMTGQYDIIPVATWRTVIDYAEKHFDLSVLMAADYQSIDSWIRRLIKLNIETFMFSHDITDELKISEYHDFYIKLFNKSYSKKSGQEQIAKLINNIDGNISVDTIARNRLFDREDSRAVSTLRSFHIDIAMQYLKNDLIYIRSEELIGHDEGKHEQVVNKALEYLK